MSKVNFDGDAYTCENETLLDALLRQRKEIPFSCKNGVCHACLMKATQGNPGENSQQGLSSRLQQKGYFLPCKCRPEEDLTIEPPRNADLHCLAIVQEKYALSNDVWCIKLESSVELFYHAGQFINIDNQEGIIRSYSLASVPHLDTFLELHVNRHTHGVMSQWLIDQVEIGDDIIITRPEGNNYYQSDSNDNLLLLATGTGLAPIIGIVRDALYSGHTGQIYCYHGASNQDGLYRDQILIELQNKFSNFHYCACISNELTIWQAVKSNHKDLTSWKVHLAGNTNMVTEMMQNVQLLGVNAKDIVSDPFILKTIHQEANDKCESEQHNLQSSETAYPEPSFDIWHALGEGELLKKIMDDFYDAVFEDPILSPYFHNSTKQRAKEKVYSFYRRLFSGERVYFGDRPRNAHHWMVISDDIFDYREALLKKIMIKHGLSDDLIQKWQTLEEIYRPDIVKNKARGRLVGKLESPAEGYGSIELSVGGMCDSCFEAIDNGTIVNYHLRTGKVYCPKCYGNK